MHRLFHIKKIFILLVMLCCSLVSLAQVVEDDQTGSEEYPSVTVSSYEKRYYDDQRLKELKNDPSFQYDQFDDPKMQNLREISDQEYFSDSSRRQNGEYQRNDRRDKKNKQQSSSPPKSEKRSSSSPPATGSFNWLLILALFAALVIILMIVLKLKPGNLFSRSAAKEESATQGGTEDIHKMQFESELDKAIRLKNFRLALRIMYLETLKKMTDQNVIHWRPEKTNWDYVREVKDPQLRAPFTEITTAYDYAWYGEFAIDEPLFRLMQQKMTGFRQKMN